MKKLGVAVFGVLGFTLLLATSALAQSSIPEPDIRGDVVVPPGGDVVVPPGGDVVVPPGGDVGVPPGGEVVVPPGAGPGGTAFTGTDIAVWMLVVAALFVMGVGLLLVAKRRPERAGV